MLSSRIASQGSLPSLSGFFWFSPLSGGPRRGACEKRDGESFVRFTDGERMSSVAEGDRFFGPMLAPDKKWTLYWRNGMRQVIEGEDPWQAMANAGMGGANPHRTLCVEGDDHTHTWDAERHDWVKIKQTEALPVAEALPA